MRLLAAITSGFLVLAWTGFAAAQVPATRPAILDDVGIDQKLDSQVSPDLVFRDETGRQVRLGDYFNKRPIILTLVYYKCPMLCTLVLNDLTRTLNGIRTASIGKDFDVITVSFDPRETSDLAAAKKAQYLREYRRSGAENGWHFLTGDESSIRQLTSTVGFRYAWDPKFQQYVHASGITLLTPQGRVSRYFFGIEYSAKDLRLSLVEASGGKIGSRIDQVLLYCFHYDPAIGKYTLAITNVLRACGILTVLAIGSFVVISVRKERLKRGLNHE
jgi:protein SCO1/2